MYQIEEKTVLTRTKRTLYENNLNEIVRAIEYFSGLVLHVLPHNQSKSENIVKKDFQLENKA